jgi:hypothetical protein
MQGVGTAGNALAGIGAGVLAMYVMTALLTALAGARHSVGIGLGGACSSPRRSSPGRDVRRDRGGGQPGDAHQPGSAAEFPVAANGAPR